MLLCTAISWAKVDNHENFHKYAEKILKAPTGAITRLLQADIVQWLESGGECRAAVWFKEYCSILTGSALEVWLWTSGSKTAWLVNKSAGQSPFIGVLRRAIIQTPQ